MLRWSLTFLVFSLIAAVLGFGGIAGTSAWVGKLLFIVFLAMFLITPLLRRRPPLE